MARDLLPRSTPEQQGISSASIVSFLDVIRENQWEVHGLMLLRHGFVIAEGWWAPYRSDLQHALYSLAKSIVSTAIGFAVSEGLIALNDRLVDLFPEDVPETVSEHLSAMTIRHALMMATGHAAAVPTWACESGNWVRQFLETPVERAPGTHFVYDTCATYMLCAIIRRVSGRNIDDYLESRLFAPLGLSKAKWDTCPRGIVCTGANIGLASEDIAKFGQFCLQRGQWQGKQLLPASWIDEATSCQIANGDMGDNDWTQGYGYQFWRCRHNTYRADGAFGQFCLVMPEQDAVLAVFSGTDHKESLVASIWGTLLPGMFEEPLAPNEAAHRELTHRLGELHIDARLETTDSQLEAQIHNRTYAMGPNREHLDTVSFEFGQEEGVLRIRNPYGEQRVSLGRGCWRYSGLRAAEPGEGELMKVAGSFRWIAGDTLEVHLVFAETSFRHRWIGRFEANRLDLEIAANLYWDWLPNEAVSIRGYQATRQALE